MPATIIFSSDCVTLCVDERVPCLHYKWLGKVDSQQLRDFGDSLLDFWRAYQRLQPADAPLRGVISDSRLLPGLDPADILWSTQNWVPRAMEAGLTTSAVIQPSSPIGRMSVSARQQLIGDAAGSFVIATFPEVALAQAWLRGELEVGDRS